MRGHGRDQTIGIIALLTLLAALLAAASSPASAQGPPPYIVASLTSDGIFGEWFAPNTAIDVTVDGIFYDDLGETDDVGTFWIEGIPVGEEGRLDLVGGISIEVTDGTRTKQLTLVDMTWDVFDLAADRVAGTADVAEGTEMVIDVGDESTGSTGFTTVDATGGWEYDFTGELDLVETMGGQANVVDPDGDATLVEHFAPPRPFIRASLTSDGIGGEWFAPNATIDVTVDGIFYDDLGETDDVGTFWIEGIPVGEEGRLDLVGGISIEVTDGTRTKQLTLVDMTWDTYDLAADRVAGTADAAEGTEVIIDVGNESIGGFSAITTVDAAGGWEYDFTGEFDLVETMWGGANAVDPEGDWTVVEFYGPFIEVFLPGSFGNPQGGVGVLRATNEGPVEVDIYDTVGGTLLYDIDATVPPAPSDNVEIDLGDGPPLAPGMYVVATDVASGYVKTLTILDVTYDTFDTENDVARGTGPPGHFGGVDFFVGGPEDIGAEAFGIGVGTDSAGIWEVTEFDLGEDTQSSIGLGDTPEGGDITYAGIEPAAIYAGIADDSVLLWGALGTTVTVEILGSSYPVPIEPPAEPGQPPTALLPHSVHGVDLVPGMTVRVVEDDLGRVQTLTLAELSVDTVDPDADSAEGSGPPSTTVLVEHQTSAGEQYQEVTTDGEGRWFADFSEAGLGPEDGVRIYVRDREWNPEWSEFIGFLSYADITTARRVVDITDVAAPEGPVPLGDPVDVSVSFTDTPGLPHAATIDWGDGTSSPADVDEAAMTASASHVYTEPGVYEITATVADTVGAGNADTETAVGFVVVYGDGFVTGGGWIESPAGAYPADPELTGTANFGFVARYQTGKSTPDGQTEFQFQAGDLDFHSSSYDWLVVTGGGRAKFKGDGTVNGVAGFGFMLTAVDNGSDGDTFRIKIWDQETEDVVYDNKIDSPDSAYDGTTLGGGSIVVHTRGAG